MKRFLGNLRILPILILLIHTSCLTPDFVAVQSDIKNKENNRSAPSKNENEPCRAVAFIGDSTSTGSMKEAYIKNPEQRLDAQLRRVGVENLYIEVRGGRSLVEHRKGRENGVMVARRLRNSGFNGCWIIALGTNDAANVAAGSPIGHGKRIGRMMDVVGSDPTIWVDSVTMKKSGYWSSKNMHAWNKDLSEALNRYPNAKIYRWSEVIKNDWWARDGIHYNSEGYTKRAELIAAELASGF